MFFWFLFVMVNLMRVVGNNVFCFWGLMMLVIEMLFFWYGYDIVSVVSGMVVSYVVMGRWN